MNFEELKKREDLMVDIEELKQRANAYLNETNKEKLRKDLEDLGCIVEEVESLEFENYISELKVYYSASKFPSTSYDIDETKKEFKSNGRNIWELCAA